MTRLVLRLIGQIKLADSDENEIAVPAVKARALLAILAESHGMRQQRQVLADMLWAEGKGQESLRQALRALRRLAGKDIFLGGTGWIGLDPAVVAVCRDIPAGLAAPPEFGADLGQVRGSEFEHWLDMQRRHYGGLAAAAMPDDAGRLPAARPGAAGAPRQLTILVAPCEAAEECQRLHAGMLLQDAASRAASMIGAEIAELDGPQAVRGNALVLACRASGGFGRIILQPQLLEQGTRRLLWSQFFSASEELLPEMLADAVAALAVAIMVEWDALQRLHGPDRHEDAASPALRDIFCFDRKRLERAEAGLARRDPDASHGQALAMRAMIRHTMLMERFAPDADACLAEAEELAAAAREEAPHNPVVLALGSLTAGLAGKDPLSLELAGMAKRIDAGHAFVRNSLSVALSFNGRAEDAHAEALAARSNRMAMLCPEHFYIRCCKTAIGIGDRASGLRWALMAIQTAPDFRAAHRAVAALAHDAGQEAVAEHSLRALQRLEPDFTLDLMADDRYPVESLRKAGLLGVTRSGLI